MAAAHVVLALRATMKTAFDAKKFIHAIGFARRLMELGPPQNVANIVRKEIQVASKNVTNAHDERREFVVDCGDLVLLYAGDPHEVCSYSSAAYVPEFKGQVCGICSIDPEGNRADCFLIFA